MEGTVKFYNQEKSFGFITGDDGKDYFFHQSGIEPDNTVREGNKVSFEVVEGDKGPKAEHVALLNAGEAEESDSEKSEETSEESEEE